MRVLVAGLGDIARKAYLPVLASWPGIELHLATRDPAVLAELGDRHRIAHRHRSVADALAAARFDAAFVHAATVAHPALVAALIEAGVAVLVDKPLADRLAEAERLVQMAVARGGLLAVGFNRRFAPDYVALRDRPRAFLLMQKHRRGQPDSARRLVFDDFIHVVDTLRFLVPGPVTRQAIEPIGDGARLDGVTLTLAGADFHAIGTMQRRAGLDEERVDAIGGDRRSAVIDLATRIEQQGDDRHQRRGDWVPVARQRGFEAMIADFLAGVAAGRATDGDDILATHRICEAVVAAAEARGGG